MLQLYFRQIPIISYPNYNCEILYKSFLPTRNLPPPHPPVHFTSQLQINIPVSGNKRFEREQVYLLEKERWSVFPCMARYRERELPALFHLFFPRTILYTQLPSFRTLAMILSGETKFLICGGTFSVPTQPPVILRLLVLQFHGNLLPKLSSEPVPRTLFDAVFLPIPFVCLLQPHDLGNAIPTLFSDPT